MPPAFKKLGRFFGDIPMRTRIMGVVALVLFVVSITLSGEWDEVLGMALGFIALVVAVVVIGYATLGLSKVVGEKAATFIMMLVILGCLGGCVGYVLSNWGY